MTYSFLTTQDIIVIFLTLLKKLCYQENSSLFFSLAALYSMQDLNSLNWDPTVPPSWSRVLNTGLWGSPSLFLFSLILYSKIKQKIVDKREAKLRNQTVHNKNITIHANKPLCYNNSTSRPRNWIIRLFSKIKSNIFIGLKREKFCIFPYLWSYKITELEWNLMSSEFQSFTKQSLYFLWHCKWAVIY